MSECENYILGKDETLVFVAGAMDMGLYERTGIYIKVLFIGQ